MPKIDAEVLDSIAHRIAPDIAELARLSSEDRRWALAYLARRVAERRPATPAEKVEATLRDLTRRTVACTGQQPLAASEE